MAAHRPSLLAGSLLALALTGALTAVDGPPGSLLNRLPRSQWQQLPRGTPAPDFQLAGIAGPGLELSDLKGRSSALVFVTTTCQYCNELKANLLDAGLPDLGGRLVFIHGPDDGPSAEPHEDSVDARVRDLYPVLQDATGEASLAYYAVSVPTAYRLDAEGTVVAAARGVGPVRELVEELAEDVSSDERCRSCP
ncbi:MAG: TlpA disulfide reductase family protein [Gemmatimonadaceae bacterium]|nr:TlpA disulfide reductase family protein [Gemmatimonadaceae bacterium]